MTTIRELQQARALMMRAAETLSDTSGYTQRGSRRFLIGPRRAEWAPGADGLFQMRSDQALRDVVDAAALVASDAGEPLMSGGVFGSLQYHLGTRAQEIGSLQRGGVEGLPPGSPRDWLVPQASSNYSAVRRQLGVAQSLQGFARHIEDRVSVQAAMADSPQRVAAMNDAVTATLDALDASAPLRAQSATADSAVVGRIVDVAATA